MIRRWFAFNRLEKLLFLNRFGFCKAFNFDPRLIHWPTYIENYVLGTKKYLLKEDLHGLPGARQHLRNLKAIRWCTNATIVVFLWRTMIARSQPAHNLWFLILNLCAKILRFFRMNAQIVRAWLDIATCGVVQKNYFRQTFASFKLFFFKLTIRNKGAKENLFLVLINFPRW